jgi:hypothetical protein
MMGLYTILQQRLQHCGKALRASDFKLLLEYTRDISRGVFLGVAFTGTDPLENALQETGDTTGWWIAGEVGTYTHFGVEVTFEELNGGIVLLVSKGGGWEKVALRVSDFNQTEVDQVIDMTTIGNNRTDHAPSTLAVALRLLELKGLLEAAVMIIDGELEGIRVALGAMLPEAPLDGKVYGRQNGRWVEVGGGPVPGGSFNRSYSQSYNT